MVYPSSLRWVCCVVIGPLGFACLQAGVRSTAESCIRRDDGTKPTSITGARFTLGNFLSYRRRNSCTLLSGSPFAWPTESPLLPSYYRGIPFLYRGSLSRKMGSLKPSRRPLSLLCQLGSPSKPSGWLLSTTLITLSVQKLTWWALGYHGASTSRSSPIHHISPPKTVKSQQGSEEKEHNLQINPSSPRVGSLTRGP